MGETLAVAIVFFLIGVVVGAYRTAPVLPTGWDGSERRSELQAVIWLESYGHRLTRELPIQLLSVGPQAWVNRETVRFPRYDGPECPVTTVRLRMRDGWVGVCRVEPIKLEPRTRVQFVPGGLYLSVTAETVDRPLDV